MISIIVPVYNVEHYIHQCVDSILNQSYSDFELILVDDGSSDKSGDICDEYALKDKRIRVLHQENAGVSAARNKGIEHAIGEWVVFVDSDDFVTNDYLADFEVDKDNSNLIIQGLEYFDARTETYFNPVRVNNVSLKKESFINSVSDNRLLHSGYPCAKAYSKSLLDSNLRFDTSISFHEDHIFVLEAMRRAKKIRLVDSIAYKYRYFHSYNTLSTKRHPWQNLVKSADKMIACLSKMEGRFIEEDSVYSQQIYTFAYSPKISAVYELYKTVPQYGQRKCLMKQIIDRKDIARRYFPNDIKNKIVKRILLHFPFFIVDIFMMMVVKYQNTRLKN